MREVRDLLASNLMKAKEFEMDFAYSPLPEWDCKRCLRYFFPSFGNLRRHCHSALQHCREFSPQRSWGFHEHSNQWQSLHCSWLSLERLP